MNQPTATPAHKRLMLLASLFVLCALLGAAAHPSGTLAANVPNPNSTLIARWEPCEPDTGVTVIVDDHNLGEGKIYVGCALGEQADGAEALIHAGFHAEGTSEYGLGFICRIDGEPTPAEQTCEHTPGASAYWTYWHGKPGGQWGFSGCGAESCKPAIGSVEGWGFNAGTNKPAPRVEPMDGAGPHAFTLPPIQESSVVPARLAREWLAPTLNETAVRTETDELHKGEGLSRGGLETLLQGVVALTQAGVKSAELAPITHWLSRTCEEEGVSLGSCGLRELTGRPDPKRYAVAILALHALGQDTEEMHLRGALEGLIEGTTGEVEEEGATYLLAPTVLALARTGVLPAKALKTIDLLLAKQNTSTGSFESETNVDVEAIEALVAARENDAVVLGQTRLDAIEAALMKAGYNLESLQEPDGGVRASTGHEDAEPTSESTGLGAVGLALTGHSAAAQRAAKWATPYQITAEYPGEGDPETGEHTPAEDLIGAFTEDEGALKEALLDGISSSEEYGVHGTAQGPTVYALDALMFAGPYGPYDASFVQQSLFFESRTVGSASKSLTATLTNEDVRPVTIAAVAVTGEEAGDFQLAGGSCAGHTLQPGQSCEAQVSFNPTKTGLHEALLQATVQGSGQTMQVPLTGTGLAASEAPTSTEGEHHAEQQPLPTPRPPSQPPGSGAQQTLPAGSVDAFKGTRTIAKARIATIAVLRCNEDSRCTVDAPRRVRVRIAGKSYWAMVLAPHELGAGKQATVAVQLSKPAFTALAGHTAKVRLTVTLVEQSGAKSSTITVVIVHPPPRQAGRTPSVRTREGAFELDEAMADL
jgi:hypothetical protein